MRISDWSSDVCSSDLHDSDGQWIAVVGIDLKTAPGQQTIRIEGGARSEQLSFQVGRKQYKTQHITLKNKSQVNPDPEQVRRYEREYKEQINAYQQFRQAGPSNVSLDKPVSGRLRSEEHASELQS